MTRLTVILTAIAMMIPLTSATAQEAATPDAEGIELVFSETYTGERGTGTAPFFRAGTDLAFDGDIIIAAQQGPVGDTGKIHLYERLRDADDIAENDGVEFELRGTIPCFGAGQNDVASFAPGIVAVAYHGGSCGAGASNEQGVSLHDINDPANPVRISGVTGLPGGTHTLTMHPSKPIIYASPGGIANGGGTQQILDFTDMQKPVRHSFQPNQTGCHDFSVVEREDGTLGICVGLGEKQIWDLENPLAPVILSRIVNPLIQFGHTGVTTSDGNLLVIGDEAIGAQECVGGPTGAMFAYDISNPRLPVPQGYFGIDRNASDNPISAQNRTNWCTAHIFTFVGDTDTMVASWYTGGVNVIDWSNPMAPREVAHYQVDSGTREGDTNYWSAYFHEGYVYGNDRGRGAFDVLEVEGLTEEDGMADAPSTREGAWFNGPIVNAPPAMHAHAQVRRLLAGDPSNWSMVCAIAPSTGNAAGLSALTARSGLGSTASLLSQI